jgi:type I restriction enzyme S subunit
MSKWCSVNLGELTELVTKGTTPPTVGEGFTDQGINYIKSDAVGYEGRINQSLFAYISPVMHDKLKRSQLKEDDILFSMAGAFLGKSGLVTADMLPANTNQALAIIRLKREIAAPRFIHYFLRQKSTVEFVNNMSGQSAQPNINFQEIKSIELALPELSEQKAIASVLSSLDDKIDLLHRQNTTLEAMAETLFRQWFVEDAQEDWDAKPLSSIANFLNGLACQKFPPKNALDRLPVLKIRELSSGISEASDWATSVVKPEYIIDNGDVIFAWSASLMVKVWDGGKCVLNQHLFKVTSDEFPKWFYLGWCRYYLKEFIGISASHATTMGHIKRGDLDAAIVVVPPDSEIKVMSEKMVPLLDKQIANAKQIKLFEKLRDTMLPKLMSGEVRVV